VPYLAALGVTDCYLSPVFTARPGSTHGYDVCNHNEISPELGGAASFEDLASELQARGMGLILDLVPNHMGIDPHTNEWWRDVLENGPSSAFARYFDIDWNPVKSELKDRLLLPVLGEQYGEALESGTLRLAFDAGALVLDYRGYQVPINPRRAPVVYEHDLDTLAAELGESHLDLREFLSVLTALRNLPAYTERNPQRIAERRREKEIARERLARLAARSAPVRAHIDRAIASFNGTPGEAPSFDRLHALLELQAYRLASWRTASDEVNYRRFFDINDLAGLRVEDPDVFDGIHRLVLRLIAEGRVTGLRLDHIDGLADPASYLRRLREATGRARGVAPGDRPSTPFYLVVEKILSGTERLPGDWAAEGTTGYTFLNDVTGLFIDPQHGRNMTRTYGRLTGRTDALFDVDYDSKRLIIGTAMTSEFQVLTNAINRLSEADRQTRDFTFGIIRRALREVIACFPVYRTYVSEHGVSHADRAIVDAAIMVARLKNPATDSSIFDFLRTVLLPQPPDGAVAEAGDMRYRQRLAVATRFQQYTAPVQAKGIEDTAFYRHSVLLSLNEVGGDPRRFGRTVASFHATNAHRREHWPLELNATATHDTKRGEDARVRVSALSEMPVDWRESVTKWMRINKGLRRLVDGEPSPDRGDEYHFYQALLAVWPPEAEHALVPERTPDALVERMRTYMNKAIREAKVHTSWVNPNHAYEEAASDFIQRVLVGEGAQRFLPAFVPFARRLAGLGMINSLAQLVLKLVSPGVPDFYQGTELWDLTLVDPDNRRAVDFGLRHTTLQSLEDLLRSTDVSVSTNAARSTEVAALVDAWPDGRIKMFVTAAGLRLRRAHPELFRDGGYRAIDATGFGAVHVVACAREHGSDLVVAVVPRLLTTARISLRVDASATEGWQDTRLPLPDEWRGRIFRSVLTGARLKPIRTSQGTWLMASQALAGCPVALLWGEPA
jgi:(1->4)-alpha-D-glucan 1-alpha-D-glucosylmutase